MTQNVRGLTTRQKIISAIALVLFLTIGLYKYNEVQIYQEAKSEGIFDTATTEIYGVNIIYHYGSENEPKRLKTKKPYPSITSGEQFLILIHQDRPDFKFVDLKRPVIIDSLFDTTKWTKIDTLKNDRVVFFDYQIENKILSREQEIEVNKRDWTSKAMVVYRKDNPKIAYLVPNTN